MNTSRVAADLISTDAAATGADEWSNQSAVARARRAGKKATESGRKRLIDPTTCERDYSAAEMQFLAAMQEYKAKTQRNFPTWTEALGVLRALGYVQLQSV